MRTMSKSYVYFVSFELVRLLEMGRARDKAVMFSCSFRSGQRISTPIVRSIAAAIALDGRNGLSKRSDMGKA